LKQQKPKNMKRYILIFAMLFGSISIMAQPFTVGNLVASGDGIQWYNTETGGTALGAADLLTAQDYWASQTVNGCESTLRFKVTATIGTTPSAPIANASQSFCSGASPKVSDIAILFGTAPKWYSLGTGGTLYASTDTLTTATDYWASQTIAGCESTFRVKVTVTVNTTPSTPTATSPQNLDGGKLVSDIVITGTGIIWYSAETGGTVIPAATVLEHEKDYWASQTIDGCESAVRVLVHVHLMV
jgi:predicted small integral membrane protein